MQIRLQKCIFNNRRHIKVSSSFSFTSTNPTSDQETNTYVDMNARANIQKMIDFFQNYFVSISNLFTEIEIPYNEIANTWKKL